MKTTAVSITTVPRGTTNVRIAASSTAIVMRTPATISATWEATSMSGFVVDCRAAAALLDLAVSTLLVDSPCLGGARRLARNARRVDVQRLGKLGAQPLERELPVLELRSPLGRSRPDDGTEPFEEPRALPRPQRRRARDVEAHLDLRVRRVRVLAAGAARAREPPLELVEGDRAVSRHPQRLHGSRLRPCGSTACT